MSWYVYLIHCADNTLYCDVGRTRKALKRFRYLNNRAPYTVLVQKPYKRVSDAINECWRVRSLRRADKLKIKT